MALTACVPRIQYQVPPLNETDRERLTCSAYTGFDEMLRQLPQHKWLSTSAGVPIKTGEDGHMWVRFDVVQVREAKMLKFAGADARGVHFECYDNLNWLADIWRPLEAKGAEP